MKALRRANHALVALVGVGLVIAVAQGVPWLVAVAIFAVTAATAYAGR